MKKGIFNVHLVDLPSKESSKRDVMGNMHAFRREV